MKASPRTLPESLGADLIAPCGMDCGLCRAYLREKKPCGGCNGDDSAKPGYCLTCKIKTCDAIAGSEISFCYECAEFPCARLRQLDRRYRTKYGMSMVENLRSIERSGVDVFVEAERSKWTCPGCGALLCVHQTDCPSCGRRWNPPPAAESDVPSSRKR